MRGKQRDFDVIFIARGITPADAGKTQHGRKRRRNHEDHPRGCGENSSSSTRCCNSIGSPPRMRGKRNDRFGSELTFRITPADAGKTFCRRLLRADIRDHPRGCGENFVSAAYAVRVPGSPPRMRGKHRNCRQYAYQHRITPADAGKTGFRLKRTQHV